jgi:hypothetical protein
MATTGWTVWSEQDARAELTLWKKSGKSLLRFASDRGYSESRLRWWRKRLDHDAVAVSVAALVPVHVVDATESPDKETHIEISLRDGLVVHVRRGFDAATLAAVVRTLEGTC